MSMIKLIGLAGTNGSGKDTVGQMLAERHHFLFVSVTDLLRQEARTKNLPVEREVLRTISSQWRNEGGQGVLVDKAYSMYESAGQSSAGLVVASLRHPAEADRVHELGGIVVWVDADPRVRYQRVQANMTSRGRAQEDRKTFQQFLAEEQAEMTATANDANLDMSGVKQRADITLDNSSEDIEVFKEQAEEALSQNL